MKIPFTLIKKSTGEEISFDIPQLWEDISVGEFVEIKKKLIKGESLEGSNLLPVFSGISANVWRSTSTEEVGGAIAAIFTLLTSTPPDFLKLPKPASIELDGVEIRTKSDIGKYSFGVIEAMTQKVTDWVIGGSDAASLDELIIYAPEVIALFSYEEYSSGEWDEERSRDLIPFVEDLPAIVGIPLAVFFLLIALESLTNGVTLLTQNQKRTQSRRWRTRRS